MSKPNETTETGQHASAWLDAVADRSRPLSQHKRTAVEPRGGTIGAARRRWLEDEKGDRRAAASAKPFAVVR